MKLLGSNIKFAVLLSVVSIMGMQTGEAVKVGEFIVSCPEATAIVPIPQANGRWDYQATSTEKGFIFTRTDNEHKIKFEDFPALSQKAGKSGIISCLYVAEQNGMKKTVSLRVDDVVATKGCRPDSGGKFICGLIK